MKDHVSFARHCLFAAAAAVCAGAIAVGPIAQATPETAGAGQGTAYLDCARILPVRVLEPDLVSLCSVFASTAGRAAA